MKCPACEAELVMSERAGVEIDYCPKCRGVWLDRGELDKILERSAAELSRSPRSDPEYREPPPGYRHSDEHSAHKHFKHRRKSFLDDLFDFD